MNNLQKIPIYNSNLQILLLYLFLYFVFCVLEFVLGGFLFKELLEGALTDAVNPA